MNSYSLSRQDLFVANIFNFKKNGHFLDIGSSHAFHWNNSYMLESLNWNGICIELETAFNETYKHINRKCKLINEDAKTIDYKKLFKDENMPQSIDYLSLDVDGASTDVLKILPHDEYKFSVITIEHDSYQLPEVFKNAQREFLTSLNYTLICADVFVEFQVHRIHGQSYEDWWVDSSKFDVDLLKRIESKSCYSHEILKKFIVNENLVYHF